MDIRPIFRVNHYFVTTDRAVLEKFVESLESDQPFRTFLRTVAF